MPDAPDVEPVREVVAASLRLALDASQMGLWDWDTTTGVLVWDERSAEMYGTTLADSTGSIADVEARVHPQDLPAVQASLNGAIETGGAVDVEFRVVHPDGSTRWLYGRGQALTSQDASVTRLIGVNADVTDVRRTQRESAADGARMAGLVAVAQALGGALSESAILEVVSGLGVTALGAAGAVLVLSDGGERPVRALATSFFGDQVRADTALLPPDFPLPMVHAATTGTPWFLAHRDEAQAAFPGSHELYLKAGTQGSAAVPLRVRGELVGALAVAFAVRHDWRPAERELMEALGALTAQALERVRSREAEQRLSESLQRSLLTSPPVVPGLEVAVRYRPAVQEAQVGGDWYDAFRTPDGGLSLVIGDVAGHDRTAAALMAQVRNILRGVAQTIGEPPAAVLAALDRALRGLELDALATAVLCQVSQTDDGWVLHWSNAGHPPPVLLQDGAHLLSAEAELLLGLEPATARSDHRVGLAPGATILLYTDGLVERRGETLDEGLYRLQEVAASVHELDVEAMADALLDQLAVDPEDDVALLVLRVCVPEQPHRDQPRP